MSSPPMYPFVIVDDSRLDLKGDRWTREVDVDNVYNATLSILRRVQATMKEMSRALSSFLEVSVLALSRHDEQLLKTVYKASSSN